MSFNSLELERKFYNLINDVDVISFDIFDTLLIRPYSEPKDLFLHLEKLFNKENFCSKRVIAEKAARLEQCSDEDIEFNEIYKKLHKQYIDLEKTELDLEAQVLKPNPLILNIYKIAVESGKTIIATSDMYLSEDFLRNILEKNGFLAVSKIYVSSKYKKCKGSKNLFKVVLDDMQLPSQKVLHVGDSLSVDYFRAKECGLKSIVIPKITDLNEKLWIKRLEKIKKDSNLLEISVLNSFFARYFYKNKKYWQRIGYCLGGPFVVAYLQKIIELSKKNNIDTLLFVSRDGYILREAYNIFAGDKLLDNHYVYAPRIMDLKCFLDYKNVPDYLQSLLSIAKNICPKISEIPKDYKEAQKLFNEYKSDLEPWAENNKKEYSDYLYSLGIRGNRIATVDMTTGAFSSLSFLTKFFKEKLIMGFFSCAFGESVKFDYHIFYNKLLGNKDTAMVNLSEFLITAPELPCVDMVDKSPVFMDINKYEQKKLDVYPEIMEGILDFVREYKDVFGEFELRFSPETVIDLWNSFLATPCFKDKKYFSTLYHAEDPCSQKYQSLYSYMGLNLFCKKYIRIPLLDFKRKCKRDLSNKVKYLLYEKTKFRVKK